MNRSSNAACGGNTIDELNRVGAAAVKDLFKSFSELARLGMEINPVLQVFTAAQRPASCEIPPPCWLPRTLGELKSIVCAGGTVSLRVRVTNCQARASQVQLKASPEDLQVEIDPQSALLAAMERRWFNIKLTAPADACKGGRYEALLWVHGCNSYYLRWIVDVEQTGSASCHELEIEDCADHVHHWYDHFYCARPCFNQLRTPVDNPG